MDTKPQKSKKSHLKYQPTAKKGLLVGSLIATFIAITPYLYSLYESVPQTQIWNTFLFSYNSTYWQDANLVMWILTGKLIPLLLLTIWFFTCRHWWYHALLVPILMYIYQIIGLFNEDLKYIDELQLLYLLPIMAIVIPSIYLIRAQMFNKLNTVDKSMEDLEEEFKIKPTTLWGKIKQYF
ncbi:hypothetical protein GZ212_06950 [Mangrovimonas sp. CR14]|uniref:hypothetical protein n=1 Tax=Mangrovimonas sp. CR14 TaxID=2706120 RepID=UPI00141D9632|nr:hypothetical protein [Mangrovimonas sp. CR14]NIK91885.1 hypothetical protein [Mangrovimonas sp. CR14]